MDCARRVCVRGTATGRRRIHDKSYTWSAWRNCKFGFHHASTQYHHRLADIIFLLRALLALLITFTI